MPPPKQKRAPTDATDVDETKSKRGKASATSSKDEVPTGNGASSHSEPADYKYMTGYGSHFESEALPGALPKGQNNPQKCAYGLYAEQLSGTSFTTPRVHNQFSWLYRIMPTCKHPPFAPVKKQGSITNDFSSAVIDPNQFRWEPFPIPREPTDFIEGWSTVAGAGSVEVKTGIAVHVYACNRSMGDKAFLNADGDLLIVPQQGRLSIRTEFGLLKLEPLEICVVPRGIKFKVDLLDENARGYMCEVYNSHFRIPDLGPIGANGLAAPRDFLHPVAAYEDRECKYELVMKYNGKLFHTTLERSPFDVVAWHGNYVPSKYDLRKFVVVNSVSVDHLDPSIFTVLTAPSAEPGVAACDFAIFPPRWCVQTKTFRPPYYHRNCMSEFMGNIVGQYDAKPSGFQPGGASLHSIMAGHGPDAEAYDKASDTSKPQSPMYLDGAMAFMFESTYMMRVTQWALQSAPVERDYYKCWVGLKKEFDPNNIRAGQDHMDASPSP